MSNIAKPVPALLKEVKHGKSQYAKRLENNRRLLRWAVQYMAVATDDLIACHREQLGRIADPEVRVEIRRCEKWLALARASLQSAKESK
jgi:hypothetical protein